MTQPEGEMTQSEGKMTQSEGKMTQSEGEMTQSEDGGESIYLGTLDHGTEIKEGYVEHDVIGEKKDWTIEDKRTDNGRQEDTGTDLDRHKDNTWFCPQVAEVTSCKRQTQLNNCTHIKLTFPGLEDDNTYRFSCVPFRHRSQVIGALGPKFTEDIFRTISRDEIIREQRKDRLLSKIIDEERLSGTCSRRKSGNTSVLSLPVLHVSSPHECRVSQFSPANLFGFKL